MSWQFGRKVCLDVRIGQARGFYVFCMSVAEKRGKCFPLPHIFRYFAASYYEKAKNVNLIIDIGNSAAKLAVFHQGEMIDMEYDTNHELGKLENICERYDIRQGILSSVIHLNDIIDSQLKRLDFPLLRLDYKTPLPVTNLYRTPKTLGSDRIAAVVGAYTRFPGRDILVVDAGTALTYEFIDRHGCYHGGNISLGKYTRIKALSAYCDKLPVINPDGDVPEFGYSTETAIRAGVIHGMELEITGYILRMQQKYPDLLVFLTGGDDFSFDTKLKSIIFADKFLVLKGLNRILEYNDEV